MIEKPPLEVPSLGLNLRLNASEEFLVPVISYLTKSVLLTLINETTADEALNCNVLEPLSTSFIYTLVATLPDDIEEFD